MSLPLTQECVFYVNNVELFNGVIILASARQARLASCCRHPDLCAGGPHFTLPSPNDRKVVSSLYFFDLREFGLPQPVGTLPGSGSIGDDRVCMFKLNKRLGKGIGKARLRSDRAFGLYTDVPSWGDQGQRYGPHLYFTYFDGCVDFDRRSWPHGNTGHGTPHGLAWWES